MKELNFCCPVLTNPYSMEQQQNIKYELSVIFLFLKLITHVQKKQHFFVFKKPPKRMFAVQYLPDCNAFVFF